ncbi:Chromate resistance protein ChrB [Priestia megaterium]|uniref:Chromate resistance protein ChrB n=1 Tax=Priestia megaterium TaxID=1404 RepID=UPI000E2EE858|nr:Chromate resistance protein ChrB [Priestia megaterium]MDN3232762.1 hypothetical protein [Priestia megaterium]RFB20456.1 hypothetical protein DZB87_26650 [Bacillus sp. ALD]
MSTINWIIFTYKIPSEPSSSRVRVWRNLKTLGVHYLQQSVCILPSKEEIIKKLKKLELFIHESGGETSILEIEKLSFSSEQMIISKFNQERTLEYDEFIEESNKFLKEIEDETNKENFSFREIEENEAELRRLKKWLVKIKKRDYFLCETNKKASDLFEESNKVLEEFTEKVYLCEGIVEGKNV